MNRPMRASSIGPYQPVNSFSGTAFKISLYSASVETQSHVWPKAAENFDALLNLHNVRGATMRPGSVDADLLKLAEAALVRQHGAAAPATVEAAIHSLSEDLAQFTD